MKHLLLTTIAAVLLVGCASRPSQSIDRNAAMYMACRVEHDVVYQTFEDKDLHLNVYIPEEYIGESPWWINDGKGKKPTLLYIHGGGWVGGSKDQRAFNFLPYVFRNWVVISINYRLAQDAKAPAAVGDCLSALEWIHANAENYEIDPDRIVVSGGSAGGHLSLLTGMLRKGDQLCGGKLKVEKTRKVAAIVNWFGVTDFNHYPLPIQWFGDNVDTEEYIRTLSPINYVREDGVPVLTIHGTEDPAVSVDQTTSFHKKLREFGINEKMYLIEGKKHGEFNPEEFTEIYEEIWKFLELSGIKTTIN
jgi:acetyl esterase/lipase